MTMIRINLIAEKKSGAPKPVKKTTGQQSEIQENLILIVAIILAVGLFLTMRHFVKKELNQKLNEKAQLEAEWERVKHWKEKKEEYEIQKELLNEKIQKITELKDRKEGPVKLMEDIANVMPESVWLASITQGYNSALVQATAKNRKIKKMPGQNAGSPSSIVVSGYANSAEAITNFANKILSMDSRYHRTSLNDWSRVGNGPQEIEFHIFFEIRNKKPAGNKGG